MIKSVAIGIAATLAGLIVVFGSWYQVDQGNLGIILRNGAVVGVAQPGLGFKVPIIDSVVDLSMRTEKASYENVLTYSKDVQTADLTLSVNYRLDPAKAVEIYSELGVQFVDSILTPAVLSLTKVVFGQFNAVAVVSERGRLTLMLADTIREAVAERGLIVESVQLENVDFSDEYEKSIEARMQAEVEVTRYEQNLARQRVQADIVRADAAGKADAVRAAAQAEADAIRLRGEAEASAIAARGKALRDHPDLVELVKAERWNGALPSTMLPGQGVPMINVR